MIVWAQSIAPLREIMEHKMNYKKLFLLTLCLLIFVTSIAAIKEYRRITNLRVKGWLFGDTTWCGRATWGSAASLDTVAVSGIDTNCYIFLTWVDSAYTGPLSGYVSRNGDSIFVKTDSAVTTSDRYNWMVIRP